MYPVHTRCRLFRLLSEPFGRSVEAATEAQCAAVGRISTYLVQCTTRYTALNISHGVGWFSSICSLDQGAPAARAGLFIQAVSPKAPPAVVPTYTLLSPCFQPIGTY